MTKLIAAAIVAFILIPSTAQARHHHYKHHHYRQQIQRTYDVTPAVVYQRHRGYIRTQVADGERTVVGSRPAGCPHAYCGCAISLRIFGRIIPTLNLASNWYRFPRTSPAPGMVAVRNHHVMQIVSVDGNGNATVYDPNGGYHRTWIHTRSLAGYTVVNPHSGRYASL